MFRCLAWKWISIGCPENEKSLEKLGYQTEIVFENDKVICDDKDVTKEIRSESISKNASKISSFPIIRDLMKKQQITLVESVSNHGSFKGAVLEGRDIGTVVFPGAEFKFYIDAPPEVRAKRRLKQLRRVGSKINFDEILVALQKRDYQDKNRLVAPLKPAADAVVFDTGLMKEDQVLKTLRNFILKKSK